MPREAAVRLLWPVIARDSLAELEPERDAYTLRSLMREYATKHGFSRAWQVKGEIVSLQRRDGSYLKSLDNFPEHEEQDRFYAMLEECFRVGCMRPTAYHDPVYSSVAMPRVPWSINALFIPQFAGGWNEAITRGMFHGMHRIYDIQSAYLSALGYGLPDPATYRYSSDIQRDGLYVVDIEPKRGAPYPYNIFPRVNATPDEIDIYGLHVKRVVGGITWARDWHSRTLSDAIENFSFWKQAGRAYWGRWGMAERVEMIGGNTGLVTPMRSIFTNLPWAHLILSRIRMRLAREVLGARDVRHVFTDSIITTGVRKTADRTIGAWKLVKEYPEGVNIAGPGKYGAMLSPYYDKWAGMPLANRGNRS